MTKSLRLDKNDEKLEVWQNRFGQTLEKLALAKNTKKFEIA